MIHVRSQSRKQGLEKHSVAVIPPVVREKAVSYMENCLTRQTSTETERRKLYLKKYELHLEVFTHRFAITAETEPVTG